MTMIYDQFNRPVNPVKKPDKSVLPAAPVLDSFREYVSAGLTPQRLAGLLKEADTGNMRQQAELFEQIEEKDAHLLGEMSKRRHVISDVEFQVEPATEDARDAEIAAFVQDFLDNVLDFTDVTESMQDAVGKGFSGFELKWDISEGGALPSLEYIEQKRFSFLGKDGYLKRFPFLVTDDDPLGIEIPMWKVMLHRHGGKSGHPSRSGIYRVCAWMYLFKNYAVKDWSIFCEVYGMPMRLGKYEPGASEKDRETLASALTMLGTDAAGMISKATEIEFVKTAQTGDGTVYDGLAVFCNREISKAVVGMAQSSDANTPGSYASDRVKDLVRWDLVRSDGRAIAATVRHQLIRPIVGFNFGWDAPCPFYNAVLKETEDLKTKSEWVKNLLDAGLEMPLSYIREQFNVPEPEDGEETLGGKKPAPVMPFNPQNQPEKQNPETEETPEQTPEETPEEKVSRLLALVIAKAKAQSGDIADRYAAQLDKRAAPLFDVLLEPVRKLIQSAGSLEEIRDGLYGLFPEMDAAEIGALMQRAMTAAELAGRFEAEENGV